MNGKSTLEMDRWYADYIAKFKAEAEGKDDSPRTALIAALFAAVFPEYVEPNDIDPRQETVEEY